jgi:hypothetical protein
MSTTFDHDAISTGTAPLRVVLSRLAGETVPNAAASASGAKNNEIVVLVAPEFLVGDADTELVRTTLKSAVGDVRLLARVRCKSGLGRASEMTAAGLAMDVLLAADLLPDDDLPPNLAASVVGMPPGTSVAELNDLALALSDMLLTGPGLFADPELLELAREQQKPIIPAGDGLPPLPIRHPDIAGWLQTQRSHWHNFGCHFAGRVEQFWLELFAFNWRGRADGGGRHSRERLRRCLSRRWSTFWPPYFAPEDADDEAQDWRKLAPDTKASNDHALIVRHFNSLDHSALYGAFLHRDLIWIAYFASAFAVFAAVMGSLPFFKFGLLWPAVELVTLLSIVGIIFVLRRTHLQDHWTACRLAAEQLRIARLCLPLFVVPSVLRSADQLPSGFPVFTVRALQEVKRAVRDQGLPRPRKAFTPTQAAAWLDLIVQDQAVYHANNERRLEHAEKRLHDWAAGAFLLAVLAVLAHFLPQMPEVVPYLLIPTAAGPAGAASLHGVRTRLGVVHRIALSRETEAELNAIHVRLDQFRRNLGDMTPERAWLEIRTLAIRASTAMGSENTSWHNLVRREKDDIM